MNEAIAAKEMSLGDYLTSLGLPMAGRQYICPFCGSGSGPNGTSAFFVYDDKRFCCHACNVKGGLLDFVMMHNKVGFKDAVRILGLGIKTVTNVPRPVYVQVGWKIPFHVDFGSQIYWATNTATSFGLRLTPKPRYINAQTVLKKAHSLTRIEICAYELKFPYHILNNMVSNLRIDDAAMMEIVNKIFNAGGYYDVEHEDWPVLVYYLTRFFPPNTFQMKPSNE